MEPKTALTFHQWLGLAVFVVLAVATFAFGSMRIGQGVSAPFERDPEAQYKTVSQLRDEHEQQLKVQDSDNDGLTDFDEMRIFRTSAFLEDSDSDGIPDGTEVREGTDPNCKQGSACREASIEDGSPQPLLGGLTRGLNVDAQPTEAVPAPSESQIVAAITETFGDTSTLTPDVIRQRLAAMSAAELRDFLLKLGIPSDALEQTDDVTLRALVQQTMEEITVQLQQNPAATAE